MEPGPSQSNIHIFTTQFFSALEDNGVNAVTKWTARKDIDIFEKKFILIPINKDLHWSLCIVVNPGKIPNGDRILPNMNNFEESADLDAPFLLLMDSLRTHNKGRIQSHIHDWLNSEAERLGRFDDLKTEAGIFNKRTMPMFDPPGT
jgi:Ulp1 family protease